MATILLITALQDKAFIGLIGEYWMTSPASTLTEMLESTSASRLSFKAPVPSHGLRKGIGGSACECWHARSDQLPKCR